MDFKNIVNELIFKNIELNKDLLASGVGFGQDSDGYYNVTNNADLFSPKYMNVKKNGSKIDLDFGEIVGLSRKSFFKVGVVNVSGVAVFEGLISSDESLNNKMKLFNAESVESLIKDSLNTYSKSVIGKEIILDKNNEVINVIKDNIKQKKLF